MTRVMKYQLSVSVQLIKYMEKQITINEQQLAYLIELLEAQQKENISQTYRVIGNGIIKKLIEVE